MTTTGHDPRTDTPFSLCSLFIILSGEFVECINISNLKQSGLPENWLRDSYVGLTASTGQLADNHDLISYITDSDTMAHDNIVTSGESDKEKTYFAVQESSDTTARFARIEQTLNTIMKRLEHTGRHSFLFFFSVTIVIIFIILT